MTRRSYRVLALSRNYPNNVMELLGLWVEGLARHCSETCEVKVVAPVPYCPPFFGLSEYTRFRRVVPHRWTNGIEVFHPRFLAGPGYSLYNAESLMYYFSVRRLVDRLQRDFAFDLIHAHFTYPDGVVAARLGRRYDLPVIITEHAPWRPWMDDFPLVRRQALRAVRESVFQIAVSRDVRDSIIHFTGDPASVRVIPCGVDGTIFTASENGYNPRPQQVLYVGSIHFVKGVDILLKAMRQLIDRMPDVRLVVVGGSFYRKMQLQEARLRRMVYELGLDNRVEFAGMQPPHEVGRHMRESAVLVLPSRAESFGAVLVEALACGTPVVATRCGGPEDIVTDQVGMLVPKDDVDVLAAAIGHVLERRSDYDPAQLRAYALENFAWKRIAHRTVDLYREALDRFHMRKSSLRSTQG